MTKWCNEIKTEQTNSNVINFGYHYYKIKTYHYYYVNKYNYNLYFILLRWVCNQKMQKIIFIIEKIKNY